MTSTTKTTATRRGGDLVLQEIWRIKDELSAARGHDVHRLFAAARKRQEHSDHHIVNLQPPQRTAPVAGGAAGKRG